MSYACPAGAPHGLVDGLQVIDCVSANMITQTYARLFGQAGVLSNALTVALTLYIALIGLHLMLGRSSLSLAAISGRTLKLGVILTFATSWSAYQTVVLNLLWAAPGQLTSIIAGGRDDAMFVLADHLDTIFSDINALASGAAQSGGEASAGARSADLFWASGFILMVSTAGSLLASRLALAVLLALGPVFIVLALWPATRGLFVGWARATLFFAIMPVISVLIGLAALRFVVPVIDEAAKTGLSAGAGTAALVLFVAVLEAVLMLCALFAGWLIVGGLTQAGTVGRLEQRYSPIDAELLEVRADVSPHAGRPAPRAPSIVHETFETNAARPDPYPAMQVVPVSGTALGGRTGIEISQHSQPPARAVDAGSRSRLKRDLRGQGRSLGSRPDQNRRNMP